MADQNEQVDLTSKESILARKAAVEAHVMNMRNALSQSEHEITYLNGAYNTLVQLEEKRKK